MEEASSFASSSWSLNDDGAVCVGKNPWEFSLLAHDPHMHPRFIPLKVSRQCTLSSCAARLIVHMRTTPQKTI